MNCSLVSRRGRPPPRISSPHGRTGHRARGFFSVAVVLAALLAAASPAHGHKGGKAEPKIAAGLTLSSGLTGSLEVRLVDADSGTPVNGATVAATAAMAGDAAMRTQPVRLVARGRGAYRGTIRFPHEGAWRVAIRVSGRKVVTSSARLVARVEAPEEAEPEAGGASAQPSHGGEAGAGHVVPLGTTVEDDRLGRSDYARMASLWIHSLAALGWIIGVLAMGLALSAHIGVIAENARTRISNAYRRWGAWIHWGFVPLIVGTGVYNMLYITPFPLAYTPADLDRLSEIPYGPLYEAILLSKLALFAVLLVTGTIMLLRVIRRPLPALVPANPHPPGPVKALVAALGPAGLIYIATIPLILAAAMSLRYVHVLSHVAEVLRSGG